MSVRAGQKRRHFNEFWPDNRLWISERWTDAGVIEVTAADPQVKLLVGHRNHPAPIFRICAD